MNYTLGLDIGIASIGWAVIANNTQEQPCKIEALGVRVFKAAEQPKTGASLALPRREARGARRRIRRHRHRLERIKLLLETGNIISQTDLALLFERSGFEQDVYTLRGEALDRKLFREEFARVLIHLAQRRGYHSNSTANAAKDAETGKVKAALEENAKIMADKGYRTVGEFFCKDEKFRLPGIDGSFLRKTRNRANDYSFTIARSMVEAEVHQIFAAQRSLGSSLATQTLEDAYCEILLSQRSFDEGPGAGPFSGSQLDKMIGSCTFEPEEQRAVKASYTFEYFKLLQDINHLRLVREDGSAVSLSPHQREAMISLAMKSDGFSYAQLRKALSLDDAWRFRDVRYDSHLEKDPEATAKLSEMQSYHKMRKALDKVAKGAIGTLSESVLNEIGRILTVYRSDEQRIDRMEALGLPQVYIEALLPLSFTKAGRLSVKAMQKIIPSLERGENYDVACSAVYGDFRGHNGTIRKEKLSLQDIDPITNPVVRRAVSQSIKVINALVRAYGPPQLVRIELAREMSNTFEERRKAESQMKENFAANQRAKAEIEALKGDRATGEDIVKYKLWREQDSTCLYSGEPIDLNRLFEPGYVDVDHIIPYSICFDDSYINKVLVKSRENRQKGNRLPLEYMAGDQEKQTRFTVLVETKIRNYRKRQRLLKKIISDEERLEFKERNLNDTKYISRVMYNLIHDNLLFAPSHYEKKPVRSVNGGVTNYMRKRMGLRKNREDGDLHHAMDAAVIAVTTDSMITRISNYAKRREQTEKVMGRYVDLETGEVMSQDVYDEKYAPHFPLPWPQFRKELEARLGPQPMADIAQLKLSTYAPDELLSPIFVSQMPNHKVTGPAHKETIRSGKVPGCSISKHPLTDLKLKRGEIENYYRPDSDTLLYEALKAQLLHHGGDGKKAFTGPFYKPKRDGTQGPLVNKVKLVEKTTLSVAVQGGVADNGSLVRIDVFLVPKDGYYFVPIYVADTLKDTLPDLASVAAKPREQWRKMSEEHFIFSLYPGDLLRAQGKGNISVSLSNAQATGEPELLRKEFFFYYVTASISTAAICVTTHDRKYYKGSLGIKTLVAFEKYQVDMLGEYHAVTLPETRMGFGKRGE